MKKLLIACMGLVLVLSIGVVAQADPPPNEFCADACSGPIGGLFSNYGQCMSSCKVCLNSGNGNFPACICKQLKDFGLLDLFGWKNQGQCVKDLGSS